MANKIKYGLKNVHYAIITDTDGTITYGTPVKLPGAVSISLKSTMSTSDIPADDNPEYATVYENKGYDGDIEFQIFSDEAKVALLGATLDSNKCLVENKDDAPVPFALLFEFSGDEKAIRHVLYNCTLSKPDVESSTKGDKAESKTDKLSIKVRPAVDTGDIKYKTSDTTTTAVYDAWYDAVTLRNSTVGA